jgi:hypothetical protein
VRVQLPPTAARGVVAGAAASQIVTVRRADYTYVLKTRSGGSLRQNARSRATSWRLAAPALSHKTPVKCWWTLFDALRSDRRRGDEV